jgi:hypothetical protein
VKAVCNGPQRIVLNVIFTLEYRSRYSDRGVGIRVPVRQRIFPSPRRRLGPTQPPIQWVLEALSPRIKRPGREADHSPPTSAEVKKMWIYTSTPHTPSWRSA